VAAASIAERQRAHEVRRAAYDSVAKVIKAQQAETERMRVVYLDSAAGVRQRTDVRNAQIAAYNAKTAAYTAAVIRHNADVERGAMTVDAANAEVAVLNAQKAQLDSVQRLLNDDREAFNDDLRQLNALKDAFNARVVADNRVVDRLKVSLKPLLAEENTVRAAVNDYNRRFGPDEARGRLAITAGHFVVDAAGARVDVFTYEDEHNLVLVLAHEFGHALGLDHLPDSTTVMHARTTSAQTRVTSADAAAYAALCPP
jgi:predicted Zn-dependent protease